MSTAAVLQQSPVAALGEIAPVTQRAMLVDLDLPAWRARKTDEKVSREVAEQHGAASRDVGNYRKRLVDNDALAEIRSIQSEAYEYNKAVTLPWSNNGDRILPSALFFDYERRMQGLRDKLAPAVDRFLLAYPQLKADAKAQLGSLYDEADYPAPRELAGRFGIEWTMLPLPEVADWRVTELDARSIARVQRRAEAEVNERFANTTQVVYRRILEVVSVMADRLRKYDPDKPRERFYDSWVDNVRELGNLLSALNVMHDPDLERVADRIRDDLLVESNTRLKLDPAARARTAEAADSILAAVSAFMQ